MLLPEPSLYDSVYPRQEVTRRNWFIRTFWCKHLREVEYHRVDSRGGPGWMSDTHEGVCCAECGQILLERKTY